MFDLDKARRKGVSEESIAIMQRVNDNNAKRDSCTGHSFDTYLPFKHRCKNCGYEADGSYVLGYQDAIKHLAISTAPLELLEKAMELLEAAEGEAWLRSNCSNCANDGCARLTGQQRKCLGGDGLWRWKHADRLVKLKAEFLEIKTERSDAK